MATVDSLLVIISARNADGLVITSGEVPILSKSGDRSPLSMPPLAAELVQVFVDEVLSGELRDKLDATGAVESRYASDKGQFWVKVSRRPNGYRLAFQLAAADAPARPPAPASAAPPTVTPRQSPTPVASRVNPPVATTAERPLPVTTGDPAPILAVLERAQHDNASDVIISTGRSARLRIDQLLIEDDSCVATEGGLLAVFGDALTAHHRSQLEEAGSCDFAFDQRHEGLSRYRVNLFRQFDGLAAAFRPIRSHVPSLAELGLPSDLYQLVRFPHGLVLVAGPTGSGKSTTLASLLEYVNRVDAKHVITIEDPIEYHYQSQQALIHQREVGSHAVSFASGLRAALRESPDIILVGEMRDPETMAAALTAAETGHLVLSTIHAADGIVAIDRIIDSFPAHQQRQVRTQLASILQAVLTQRLLPRVGGGRVPAHETMLVNSAIAAMIRDDKCHQIRSQIQTGKADGMITMDRSLRHLLERGEISREVAQANRSNE